MIVGQGPKSSPRSQELAHLEAVLVVHEDSRAEIVAGDEHFGHNAESFTDENGGSDDGSQTAAQSLASVQSGTVTTSPGWPRCWFSLKMVAVFWKLG